MDATVDGARRWLTLTALEAGLVVFVATGDALLGRVHGLLALGALGVFDGLERHGDGVCLGRPADVGTGMGVNGQDGRIQQRVCVCGENINWMGIADEQRMLLACRSASQPLTL